MYIYAMKTTQLTIENLKARKSYIIAKIAKLGMADRTAAFMGVMKMEVEMGCEKTIYELLMEVYHSMRTSSRKTTKVAEGRARVSEATGVEQISWGEQKFGKQHNF
ncbi:MAG: hypothetical protein EBR82_63305 [Caulobacteraceae bacterium]|nr:hypothetical protein [Caulobacteraceae bacterium]